MVSWLSVGHDYEVIGELPMGVFLLYAPQLDGARLLTILKALAKPSKNGKPPAANTLEGLQENMKQAARARGTLK